MIAETINKHGIEGLAALAPDPEMRGKLMLFGQFVGDWDILEAATRNLTEPRLYVREKSTSDGFSMAEQYKTHG
jgi:hypothetical protein